ncbi:MAG: hypothetical protein AAF806_02045 [Bacteroidota bacterium]
MWQELLKIALIGAERTPLSDEMKEELAALGIPVEEQSETQSLLESIAYYAQLEKINISISDFKGQRPSVVREAPYPVRFISSNSIKHFQTILSKWQLSLPEFSRYAQENSLFLPPEYLPLAFNYVRENEKSWDSIAPLVEEHGWWLVSKNKYWKFLANRPYRTIEIPKTRVFQATQGIKEFQESLQGGRTYLDQADWNRIKRLAFSADLNQYDSLRNNWNPQALSHPMWNGNLNQLFRILDFRRAMIKTLQVT